MKNWANHILKITILFLTLTAFCIPVHAEETDSSTVLTVAFPENTGINEVYEDGTYGGCVYDWLHEISKYTGWKYEFVTGNASELLNEMGDGKYDLMGGMYYVEQFKEYYCYPKYVMGSNYSLLIYRQDDDSIKNFDYTTLNGKKIGVLKKATSKIERLEKFLTFNKIKCELVYYESLEDYESCLEKQEVDLLYGNDVYMKEGYNVAAKIEADPYYIVTSSKRPDLCEQLSEAMSAIYSANPNFAADLYNKYFPSQYINSIVFTEEESQFIQNSKPISVAVLEDRHPLYYEEDGEIKGMIPACLNLVAGRTGLTFEYTGASSYGELLEIVQSGKADLIGCFMDDDYAADSLQLIRTARFAALDSVILRSKQSNPSSGYLMMALPSGKDTKPRNEGDSIRYYETYEDCLNAVNRGEADYTQIPAAFVEDLYTKNYYANITILADTNEEEELTLALASPANVCLYSVLNKAIYNLSEDELNSISSQDLLATRSSAVTVKSLLYTNPVMVISICVGFVILVSAIILLVNIYKMKTKMMRLKLEKAEETSRAKSDFLSRMSHEIRTPMNAIIGLTNLALMTEEAPPVVKEDLLKIDSSAKFLLSLLNDVLDMSKIDCQKMKLETAPFDLGETVDQLKNMFLIQAEQKGVRLLFDCPPSNSLYVGDEMRIHQILTNLLSNACKFTDKGGRVTLSISETSRSADLAGLLFCVKDTGIGIKEEDLERIFHSFEQSEGGNRKVPGTGLGLSISRSLVRLMGGDLQVKSTAGEGSEFYFTIQLPIYRGTWEKKPSLTENELPELNGLTVLLAEDNEINAEIAMELLSLQNIQVEWAENGQQAVDLFASHPAGYYDLILMDVNMPVKDGLTATREIRAMDRPDADAVPILAMTANTFQEDREQASNAGMTGFLPKPFDVEQLYRALWESVGQKE